ncbi:DUF4214 domain-containing protein [Massilia horti]|uniref:DUF4214 domain-containing protein n=1 Tax=Massilia horti TaxID=2562153 RepID=A0A4Y9SNH5_9BURK|nr:DUF4214 domain-containing protein [Massilia horti]TFW28262.1 DUF4214 domain-containing protein [Massilia horti]
MATVSDVRTPPLSGLWYIDALLSKGPGWNYQTGTNNTLFYTFSITAGTEAGTAGLEAFNAAQQACVITALDYLTQITGIQFALTDNGNAAQIHFAYKDIAGPKTAGECSWNAGYSYNRITNELGTYQANAYVYLDNMEWYAYNSNLTPGGFGYETLLHELGHALGLKHPFLEADDPADTPVLPKFLDNIDNTLMSYTVWGAPHTTYSQYDIAALNWLYGGDGLRGAVGINSTTGARYFTGTSGADILIGTPYDDILEGDGGNDFIDGGDGIDTVVFRGPRSDYTFSQFANGDLLVRSGIDGIDILRSIELFRFSDGTYQLAQALSPAAPPAPPKLTVSLNAAGYAKGNAPTVSGEAQANATVTVYYGDKVVATTKADASGIWQVVTTPFADGLNYSVYAKATDAAGYTSKASASVVFNIDATPPAIPTASVASTAGSNQPVFFGTGEAGATIELVRSSDHKEIGRTTVDAHGNWKLSPAPLPDGAYDVQVLSVDLADNATSATANLAFSISSALNGNGTDGNDVVSLGPGSHAYDGGVGLDTVNYSGAPASYTIARDALGVVVTDNAGTQDRLINVERLHFGDDTWLALDIDGAAGQAYRLYRAAFDRAPDLDGLGFWMQALDNGVTLYHVAESFLTSQEYLDKYGADLSDENFLTQLYHHVLHREPDGEGFQWWLDALHNVTRAEVLASFSESPENQAQVIGSIQNGINYMPYFG